MRPLHRRHGLYGLLVVGPLLVMGAAAGGSDIAVPVILVATLIAGGIGYGVTKQKADAAHKRIDALDTSVREGFNGLTPTLTGIEVSLGRIDERMKTLEERDL